MAGAVDVGVARGKGRKVAKVEAAESEAEPRDLRADFDAAASQEVHLGSGEEDAHLGSGEEDAQEAEACPEPKRKSRAKVTAKSSPKRKAKSKAKSKVLKSSLKTKNKGKIQDEDSVMKRPAARKAETEEAEAASPKTFAGRRPPKTEQALVRFNVMQLVFKEVLAPKVLEKKSSVEAGF